MSKQTIKQKRNKKLVSIITVLFFSALLLGGSIGYILASGPSYDTYYGAGGQVEVSTYTIFKDGSTYYAKNGVTGAIDYSSSNVSSVTMSSIGSGDVKITFVEGTFDFPTMILIPDNVEIAGLGYGSIITTTTLTSEALFRSEGLVAGNEVTSTPNANITIRDLHFMGQGNGSTIQNGFDFANCDNVKVLDNYFENFRAYFVKGWYSDNVIIRGNIGEFSYGEGLHTVFCNSVVMTNNIINQFWDVGIAVAGGVNSVVIGNVIEDTSAVTSPTAHGAGIDISGSRNITVTGNSVYVPKSHYGIMSMWFDNIGQPCIEQVVSGNVISYAAYYGIVYFGRLDQGTDTQYSNIVIGNKVSYSGRHGIFFQNTGWSKIADNYVLSSSQEVTDTYSGIVLASSANNNQTRIVISGNYVIDAAANKAQYGILIGEGVYYTFVFGNYVRGQVTNYYQDGGVDTIVHSNVLNDVWVA